MFLYLEINSTFCQIFQFYALMYDSELKSLRVEKKTPIYQPNISMNFKECPKIILERKCHINKKLKAVKTRQIWENFGHTEYELFIRNTIFIKHSLNTSMGLKFGKYENMVILIKIYLSGNRMKCRNILHNLNVEDEI